MSVPLSDTQLAAYRDLSFLDGAITQFDQTAAAVAATRALVREVDRLRAQRAAMVELHDWDELVFGGFYCMHCSPEGSLDEPISWPCPTLRAVGMTDEEALAIITAHRAAIAATTAKES